LAKKKRLRGCADEELRGYEPVLRIAAWHFGDDLEGWTRFVESLPARAIARLKADWHWQAHGGQREPPPPWTVWLLMAGRGFGKTRAGAEWISARAREVPDARIALVGGSRDEVAKVMIEGPSGLIRVARLGEQVIWKPTLGTVRLSSGATAFVYSAEAPEGLRGPEHNFAWADELAKWPERRADAAWDNLMMGLRLGSPRLVVTTTPRPVPLLRRVMALDGLKVTGGATEENVHLGLGRGPGGGGEEPGRRHGRKRAPRRGGGLAGEAGEREPGKGCARGAGGGAVRGGAGEARGALPRAGGRACGPDDRRRLCGAGQEPRPRRRLRLGDDRADAAQRTAADRGAIEGTGGRA
jgi:hypothetical protein